MFRYAALLNDHDFDWAGANALSQACIERIRVCHAAVLVLLGFDFTGTDALS